VFSTDQTHLRRYITTLGVAIAAGTLSLSGLFLKLQQDMLVTRSTLAQVTPTARVALLERQRYLAFGTSILPYFVLVGFLGGLSLAAYGMIGWRRRQKVADALEDLALRRGQVELRQMTVQEQAEKLTREAEESAADIVLDSVPQNGQPIVQDNQQLVSEFRNRAMILETSLVTKLQAALGSKSVQANIRSSGPSGRVTVDAIAHVGDQSIVFELKYTSSYGSAVKRMTDALIQVERGVRAVIDSGATSVYGVLILVVADSVSDNEIDRLVIRANERISELEHLKGALVVRYPEFLSLPPEDLVSRLALGQRSA
jgi:hypothetical protein